MVQAHLRVYLPARPRPMHHFGLRLSWALRMEYDIPTSRIAWNPRWAGPPRLESASAVLSLRGSPAGIVYAPAGGRTWRFCSRYREEEQPVPRPGQDKWPCVFRGIFIREVVDPKVKRAYDAEKKKANFGDLRRTWREEHCKTLNPYGSDTCPYPEHDCALAFYKAATDAAVADNPGGAFRRKARIMALDRAENKPLSRDAPTREARSGDAGPAPADLREGSGVYRPPTRPVRIGSMFGTAHARPRQGQADDGKASPK